MAPPVPTSAEDLTTDWASQMFGADVDVVGVTRIGAEYGFAGETYRLDLFGYRETTLAVKLWEMRGPDDDRELRFYREIAADVPIRLPRFHAGGSDPASLRAWLAMEHLADCRQGDDLVPESPDSLARIVETLATLHASTSDRLNGHPWLATPSRGSLDAAGIADRTRGYVERFGPLTRGPATDLFEALPRLIPEAHTTLDEAPGVLLHRDLAYDNMLFAPPDDEPIILDWQWCQLGAGVRDLAGVLFRITDPAVFRATIDRYLTALERNGAPPLRPSWLDAALVLTFATFTLGVVRWAAETERGLTILDRTIDETPHVVEAWRSFDSERFDRMLAT